MGKTLQRSFIFYGKKNITILIRISIILNAIINFVTFVILQHFLPLPGFLMLASDISTHLKSALSSEPLMLLNLITLPTVLVYLLGNVLSQYICARSIFHLSTEYSSLTITMILTLRKFFSIFISVWLFDNVFTFWHWIGTIFVFIGTLLFSDMHSNLIAKLKTNENKKDI